MKAGDTSEAKPRQVLVGSSYLPPVSQLVLNAIAQQHDADDTEQLFIGTNRQRRERSEGQPSQPALEKILHLVLVSKFLNIALFRTTAQSLQQQLAWQWTGLLSKYLPACYR